MFTDAEFFTVGNNLLNISIIGQESYITQNFVITCSYIYMFPLPIQYYVVKIRSSCHGFTYLFF